MTPDATINTAISRYSEELASYWSSDASSEKEVTQMKNELVNALTVARLSGNWLWVEEFVRKYQ